MYIIQYEDTFSILRIRKLQKLIIQAYSIKNVLNCILRIAKFKNIKINLTAVESIILKLSIE